jgi:hypothetical protein
MSSFDSDTDHSELEIQTVELQIALGLREFTSDTFERALGETVEELGGVVLFLMRIEEDDEERAVAAVSLPSQYGREVAIVTADAGYETLDVVPADRSPLPVAALATSYAGLAESWRRAA